jgi:L-lactate dehydrogenase complex protein LldF
LCGACYDVCPVKINIPEILIFLRGEIVREEQSTLLGKFHLENVAMQAMALVFSSSGLMNTVEALAKFAQRPFVHKGVINSLPGMLSGWTDSRDLMPLPRKSFRDWWAQRAKEAAQ